MHDSMDLTEFRLARHDFSHPIQFTQIETLTFPQGKTELREDEGGTRTYAVREGQSWALTTFFKHKC